MATETCYRCGAQLKSYFRQFCDKCRAKAEEDEVPDAPSNLTTQESTDTNQAERPRGGVMRNIDRFAELVADSLMMNDDGDKAKRLVLELPDGRDGGGLCRDAIIGQVRQTIVEWLDADADESDI